MADDATDSNTGSFPSLAAVEASALATCAMLVVTDPFAPTVAAALERLHATARATGQDYFEAGDAAGTPVDARLAAALVSILVCEHWQDHGARQILHLETALALRSWDEAPDDRALVYRAVSALEALAHLQLAHDDIDPHELITDVCLHVESCAHAVQQRGAAEHAVAALGAACDLVGDLLSPDFLRLSESAAAMARAASLHDDATRSAMRVAQARLAHAQHGSGLWLTAQDACETVIRHLPHGEEAIRAGLSWVATACRHPGMEALRPWLGLITADMPAPPQAAAAGLAPWLPVLYKGSEQQFLQGMPALAKLVQTTEDQRLPYETAHSRATGTLVAAEWTSWSFRHHAFRAAIPHGDSFLRERDRHQLLLVMRHELTHLQCMFGAVGVADMALRAAQCALELDLWGPSAPATAEGIFAQGVAPITGSELLMLGRAEQALEVLHKRRVLEDCWAPWFEGVAVFEELAGDPMLDEDAHAPAFQMLANLVELVLPTPHDLTQEQKVAALQQALADAEARYAEALRAVGQARLITYMSGLGPAYLCGYLAVRGVVAAWRRNLATPISGAQAGRILVYMTRARTAQAVPELDLPLVEFRQEAVQRHLGWVREIARAPAELLQRILGRVTVQAGEPPAEEGLEGTIEDRVVQLAARAYDSLAGARSPLDRVPEASEACHQTMRVVANALDLRPPVPEPLTRALARHYTNCLMVLPVGEVQAPFWLVESSHSLYLLLRTTEVHHAHGTPSYNGMYMGLPAEEFAALREEVRRTGATRMRVTRLADLLGSGFDEDRGFGRHALAMQVGTWSHVIPVGLLVHGQAVSKSWRNDICMRTGPNPVAVFDQQWIAPGVAGARRTLGWLDTVEAWYFHGEDMELGPWAAHVRAMADDIADDRPSGVRDEVARCLLALLVGDMALADTVVREGLGGLADDDAALVSQAVRVLQASALRPDGSAAIRRYAAQWSRLFACDTSGHIDVVAIGSPRPALERNPPCKSP